MSSAPEIVTRPEQPYAAIRVRVSMADLAAVVPPLNQEVFVWLGKQGTPPAGAPFWKYNVIDMAGKLEIEAGVPVAASVPGGVRGAPGRAVRHAHPRGSSQRAHGRYGSAAGLGGRTGPDLGRNPRR